MRKLLDSLVRGGPRPWEGWAHTWVRPYDGASMKYDPEKHQRTSIRLRGYDYSQPGCYFVTICTFNRECALGQIVDSEVRLNAVGSMVMKWWLKLSDKFPSVAADTYVIMPNHVHGIIGIVGADPCVRPGLGPHVGASLSAIVRWFKTMTSNEYLRMTRGPDRTSSSGRLWQRNYFEHIIRNERTLTSIREYIEANPVNWADDPDNPDFTGKKRPSFHDT